MYYTGIGSRETPKEVLYKMFQLGASLGLFNYVLRSGGADGADKEFERASDSFCELVDEDKGKCKEIYLPWKDFNSNKSQYFIPSNDAFTLAATLHPAWDKLTQGAKRLHARNCHQVLGLDLKTPSDFVICWTPKGQTIGGTATAINLAKKNSIPVYNLYGTENEDYTDLLKELIK